MHSKKSKPFIEPITSVVGNINCHLCFYSRQVSLFFLVSFVVRYILVLCFVLFEYFSVIKPSGAALDDEDEDVAKERRRVMSGGAEEDVLKIQELTKVVKTFGLNRSNVHMQYMSYTSV